MQLSQNYNKQYSKWYFGISQEYRELSLNCRALTIKRKSDRINNCMDLWIWDLYKKNKVMDLQKVNRCKDRFCPNCKKFSLAITVHNLQPTFKSLLAQGYYPYLLTLTVPNCSGKNLRTTIDKIYKSFTKFYYLFSKNDRHAFKDRYLAFDGALRVLEVTCNDKDKTYHPHLHCMVFSKYYDRSLFSKYIQGEYSNKRKSFNFYSDFDIQIRKLWTMCYNGVSCTSKHYDLQEEMYLCDIKEMDSNGFKEVLKYTFKDTDIRNYSNFKNLFFGLEGKRIRQGYGLLYNLKLDDDDEADGEKIELDLSEKENPELLVTREINQLIISYSDFRKVSRFKNYEELKDLE